MILLIIFGVLTIGLTIAAIIIGRKDTPIFSVAGAVVFGICFLVCIILTIIFNNSYTINRENTAKRNTYNTLILELSDEKFRDDFNIRNIDLVNNVTSWNSAYEQYMIDSKNPWVNAFCPAKIYDGTGYININDYIDNL